MGGKASRAACYYAQPPGADFRLAAGSGWCGGEGVLVGRLLLLRQALQERQRTASGLSSPSAGLSSMKHGCPSGQLSKSKRAQGLRSGHDGASGVSTLAQAIAATSVNAQMPQGSLPVCGRGPLPA
jgi:hypothetical protein